ncbi:MAG: ribonuclease HII [Solirubrobacterales bacterium]|nr:ribonuclease HII [Solirubrobacterales bacterium]
MPTSQLLDFDRARGSRVAGADEVGRGCLAGPIVAAAVAFDYETIGDQDLSTLEHLKDSKKLSAPSREMLFGEITRLASSVALVSRSANYIDLVGLHRTNLHCLGSALSRVNTPGTALLSDGYMPFGLGDPCEAVVKGDATSAAIAAASIIAKVSRDRYMNQVATAYPDYAFDKHVGYATPVHREAIIEFGPTPIHRRSFASTAYEQFQRVA